MSGYTPDGVWAKARALLVGYWPALSTQLIDEDGADTDTAALWRAECAPFGVDDLLTGIREMAQRIGDAYPSLPVLLPYLRAARTRARQNVPSLAAPQYLAVEGWENGKIAELRQFVVDHPGELDDYELGRRIAKLREEGPFFQRVRGLQDGSDRRTVDQWWRETFSADGQRRKGPESLVQLIGRKEPRLEDVAGKIAAEYQSHPEAWPKERIEALDEDVRTAVRELLAVTV